MTLKNAIDKDFFYIENISYSDDEIKAMSLDELETLKMQITKKISGLSLSLKEKQEGNNGLEECVKRDWSMSRKRALYINQRILTYVNFLVKKKNQIVKSFADFFMDSAKQILPDDIYQGILIKAHMLMEGKQ